MALTQRIKELRTRNGLSQAALADRLHVSRQAVTKWEAGRGIPGVDNLRAMAALFGVSVDHLLDGTGDGAAPAVLRHPVDVASLEPYKPAGRPLGAKSHRAVREAFPDAVIYPLARMRSNNRVQEFLEWGLMLAFDIPYGLFGLSDSLSNRDAYYLVEEKNRHVLARVTPQAVEGKELPEPVEGRTFTVGADRFRRTSRPL